MAIHGQTDDRRRRRGDQVWKVWIKKKDHRKALFKIRERR